MKNTSFRLFLLLWIGILGLLSWAGATTRTVPNATGIAATDSANIQNTINTAVSGDTVAFQSGGQYVVNTTIYLAYHSGSTTTVYNNVIFNGNGCTIADGGISWFVMDIPWGSSNITFNQFTLKGLFPNTATNTVTNTAYDGGLMIEGGSYITAENSLFEDFGSSHGLVGGESVGTGISVGSTLTNAVLTGNTFTEIAEYGIFLGAGGGVSGPLTISNNTFSIGDCVQGADYGNCTFQSLNGIGTSSAAVLYQNNTGTCVRNGIEICPGGDNTGPKLTNLTVTGNTMSFTNTQNDGNGLIYSFAFGGTGTITNNVAIGQSGSVGVGYENQLCNSTYTNNTVENAGLGFASAGEANDVFTYNLVANTNNFYDDPWGFGKQGLADNNLYDNWFYASNTNASGNFCDSTYYNSGNDAYFGNTGTAPGENTCISSPAVCPTLSIAETSNPTVGGANGIFTITSTVAPPSGYPLSVYYTLSGTGVNGTDYTITPASPATIAAGSTSTTLSVTGITSGKTVIATLAFGGYYINSASKSATMNISAGSLPTVTVSASPTSVNEASGSSTYTFTRTGATTSALTVYYAMSGAAVNGTDYTTLSGSLTIASGSATGTVTLTAIDEKIVAGSKTAILTISTNANYTVGSPSSATVTINDNDTSAIPTGNLNLWVEANTGVTTSGSNVTNWTDLSGTSMNAAQSNSSYQPTYVSSDVNGLPGIRFNGSSQYLQMPSGFTGLNNGITAFVVTNPTGTSSWGQPWTIDSTSGGPSVKIQRDTTGQDWWFDAYTPSWGYLDSSGSTNLTQNSWQLLEATETSAGSATIYKNGANAISGTLPVPANQSYINNYIGGSALESQYWTGDIAEVIIYNTSLSTTNRQTVENYLLAKYGIGVVLPTVTIAATTATAQENGPYAGVYTVTRTGATTSALTVNYAMSGTAVNGTDYTTLSGSVTIASGSTTATITLTPIDESIVAGSKTAIATISSSANYTVGSPSNATVTIQDDDITKSTMQLWLRSDKGVSTGSTFTWADQSGKAMNATQATSTYQPTLVSGDISYNGQSYAGIRFNGSNEYLQMPSGFTGLNAGMTVFIVTDPTGTSTWGQPWTIDSSTTSGPSVKMQRDTTAQDWWFDSYNGTSFGYVDSSGSTNLTQSSWQLLEGVVSSTGATTIYKNGANAISGTITALVNQTYTNNYVGGSALESQYWTGDIVELIIYNSALSTTDRQNVENYISVKYGF